jgi:hypothetical protein
VTTRPVETRIAARLLVAVAIVLLAGCAGAPVDEAEPEIPGAEYIGTWSRGSDVSRSMIAIYHDGEQWLFRWRVRTEEGNWRVDCDWDGHCEEFVDGEKVGDHYFEVWLDEATGHLMVECNVDVFKPRAYRAHFIDELVVENDGTTLWSYTVERNGTRYEGDARPRRTLEKTSDTVASPPR